MKYLLFVTLSVISRRSPILHGADSDTNYLNAAACIGEEVTLDLEMPNFGAKGKK